MENITKVSHIFFRADVKIDLPLTLCIYNKQKSKNVQSDVFMHCTTKIYLHLIPQQINQKKSDVLVENIVKHKKIRAEEQPIFTIKI